MAWRDPKIERPRNITHQGGALGIARPHSAPGILAGALTSLIYAFAQVGSQTRDVSYRSRAYLYDASHVSELPGVLAAGSGISPSCPHPRRPTLYCVKSGSNLPPNVYLRTQVPMIFGNPPIGDPALAGGRLALASSPSVSVNPIRVAGSAAMRQPKIGGPNRCRRLRSCRSQDNTPALIARRKQLAHKKTV